MLKDLEFEAESISLLLSVANFSFSLNLEFLIFSDLKCSIFRKITYKIFSDAKATLEIGLSVG